MKKTKILIIAIILIFILIISVLIVLRNINTEIESTIPEEEIIEEVNIIDYKEVTNPHMYLTVKSCVEKYLTYVYKQDAESVYKILDNNYKNKFNISKENVFEFVEKVGETVNLKVKEMYVSEKSKEIQQYYILGTLVEEGIDGIIIKSTDNYIITVELDTENMIYSIIPDGYGGPLYEKK